MNTFNELKHAFRLLSHSPVFALTAIGSVGVGVAAVTVIFALADGLLLRASPGVRDASRVVDIERTTNGGGHGTLSYPVFLHLRDSARSFEAIAAVTTEPAPLSVTIDESSERVYGSGVSSEYFDALGVRTAMGRFFSRHEEDQREDTVAVLSHRLWRDRFQSDPGILDRALRLNNRVFTIVGVAEEGFEGHTIAGVDLWVPIAYLATTRGDQTSDRLRDPAVTWHKAIGRLRPGAARPGAQAELTTLFEAFKASNPGVPRSHGLVVTAGGPLPPAARLPFGAFIGLLFTMAVGLLVIACSNVTGVLLARASSRRREMATRLAVGATRRRLIAQMLLESLVLFSAGAACSIPLMIWLSSMLQSFLPALPFTIAFQVTLGLRAAVFAAVTALVISVLSGLAPARHALRTDVASLLHGHTSTPGRDRLRVRQMLVVVQVALSLATFSSAGLFVRTLRAAGNLELGFSTQDVLVASVDTASAGIPASRAVPLVDTVVDRLRSIEGVEAVGHSRMMPLQGGGFHLGAIRLPEASDEQRSQLADTNWDVVSPDYFRTIRLPLVAGRPFGAEDGPRGSLVAIVNEVFARIAWPGRAALGQQVLQTTGEGAGRVLEVVGVVGDARYRTITEAPRPFIYVPFAQQPQTRVELFVRHAAGRSPADDVRNAVRSVEPALPLILVQSFDDAAAVGLLPQRVAAWLGSALGLVGILLAGLGVYGLCAFVAAQRSREIAIRMALGATRRDVRSMILRETSRLAMTALPLGSLVAFAAGRLVQSLNLLVGVGPNDAATFLPPVVFTAVVLFAATWWPARRAATTDPADALRAQ